MADSEDKAAQRERYRRMEAKHVRSHEEERVLRTHSKARKAARRPRSRTRPQAWDEEDAGFERIERAAQARLEGSRRELPPSPLELPADARRARVLEVHRARVVLRALDGARERLDAAPPAGVVVGDELWISGEGPAARVIHLAARRTWLARGAEHGEDVLAANVDVGLIVVALRRPGMRVGLVRRVALALAAGGIESLVVANKLDLLSDVERAQLDSEREGWDLAPLEVCCVSAATGEGLHDLRGRIAGRVAVAVGHSGVGKSSLVNALCPAAGLTIGPGREFDGKGRHTTSASSTWELADGTWLVDTPGVRAFATTSPSRAELGRLFPDVAALAECCRFADCGHAGEPGCAVGEALERGLLEARRWRAWRELAEESD
ncbi:MAG TPA: ribosome small subunit-dependent GTPase A [Planctomycetota bacterium]|nr:ribosome small subunit-dependent GTPase A [Planctomycetota bacterium]